MLWTREGSVGPTHSCSENYTLHRPKGVIRIQSCRITTWISIVPSFTEVVVSYIWWDGCWMSRTTTWTCLNNIIFRKASSESPNVLSWWLSMGDTYPINIVAINWISPVVIMGECMYPSELVANDAATHLAILLLRITVHDRVATSSCTLTSIAHSPISWCQCHCPRWGTQLMWVSHVEVCNTGPANITTGNMRSLSWSYGSKMTLNIWWSFISSSFSVFIRRAGLSVKQPYQRL